MDAWLVYLKTLKLKAVSVEREPLFYLTKVINNRKKRRKTQKEIPSLFIHKHFIEECRKKIENREKYIYTAVNKEKNGRMWIKNRLSTETAKIRWITFYSK